MKYIPADEAEKKELLKEIGVESFEELIKHIPESLRTCCLNLKEGISEYELMKEAKILADKNICTDDRISFRGGGIYDHYIPPAIRHIALRPEFYTAYTPYQPEVSQGTLQIIYEYQSMICELYGMEIANASMYDGFTAAAEACHMAMGIKNKHRILISDGMHPTAKKVINTYLKGQSIDFEFIPLTNGKVCLNTLKSKLNDKTAAFILQTPNFFGVLEDGEEIGKIVHEAGAMFIVSQNPMTLGVIKSPGEIGADIAVGEGQVLGISQSFGGPLLGIFTSKKEYARHMPGRIIAKTTDKNGKEGFVMTLQTREQHIRREKATSNICTNEGLCMLMASVYLELVGKKGFIKVSEDSFKSAHYLYKKLVENGFEPLFKNAQFFNEFAVKINNSDSVYAKMKDKGFLAGVKLNSFSKEWKDLLLFASTEKRSAEEIDDFVNNLKEAVK